MIAKTAKYVSINQNYSELSEDDQINLIFVEDKHNSNNTRIRKNILSTPEFEKELN
jgi:phage pi2 protein 07